MSALIYLFVFCFGLIVGSFLNVVIYRYNTGATGWRSSRSKCLACSKPLRWFELVPLLSFFVQGGRCRRCLSRISWQYPAVEGLSGFLFLLCYLKFGLVWLLPLYLVVVSLLLVITVYDLRHKIIPNGLVYGFLALALISGLVSRDWAVVRERLLAGGLLFAFFFALWYLSSGRWMGFGDAKLGLGVGLLLGLAGGISAIVLAFWVGALVGLGFIALTHWSRRAKSFNMKTEIPFAPFIVLGLALNLFFNFNVISFFF